VGGLADLVAHPVVLQVAEHPRQLVGVRVVRVDYLHAELAQLMLEVEAVAQVPAQPGEIPYHHHVDQTGAAHLEQSVEVGA
jgi:hypothetical protein